MTYSKTIEYLSESGLMANFIRYILDWQEYVILDDLQEAISYIPEHLIEEYVEDVKGYRGMVVAPGKIKEKELCSYTVDLEKARYFSNRKVESLKFHIDDQENTVGQIYERTGKFYMLYKLIIDLKVWITTNYDGIMDEIIEFIDDAYTAEDIIKYFHIEGEILCNFKLSENLLIESNKIENVWSGFGI